MKKRTYTRTDGTETKVFNGMDKDFSPENLEHIVLISVEGEIEVWAVESPEQEAWDLLRYYGEQGYPLGAVKFLGVFTNLSPSLPSLLSPPIR